MGIFDENEFNNFFINNPLRVLIKVKPLSVCVLVTVFILIRCILYLVNNLFELINTPYSFFKKWTPEILLSDLQFP